MANFCVTFVLLCGNFSSSNTAFLAWWFSQEVLAFIIETLNSESLTQKEKRSCAIPKPR
jgi:hypothetical protein